MINELVVATHNQGKVEEFKVLMKDLPIEIKYLADFDAVEAPAETGRTFAANARQKATYYAKKLGKPCIADDCRQDLFGSHVDHRLCFYINSLCIVLIFNLYTGLKFCF